MKKLLLFAFIIISTMHAFAGKSLVDSLQKQIDTSSSNALKGKLYTQMAVSYMNYNAIQDRQLKTAYQENALKYTLSALHQYSRMDDSTGLRTSYDRLAKVYHDQKKFSQAKWFILQSNTLAREQRDVPNIVASLITLADIKMDIHDFDLARGDLREALELSSANCFTDQQLDVMLSYARLYNSTNSGKQAAAAMKRYAYVKDSTTRDSEARMAAKLRPRKKYLTTTTYKHLTYKNASQSVASL
ncbi:hypothetical protein [Mucilaginibacter polytrichastri]|uniref:MalT-like TPR region domain-containing protein n=1 Tax=Mucilaginibacter polytrichastri TaxID=1302689 RepID=A0A1Q5ZYH3_9SPHI|nr:hypothetical protein [Mucilaginibacter polytrichastri]OKS86788.1 hypothetical protein RG47T_2245 [Mucilaginibacter polytrichastri]SFT22669.1 hypothetical protein SAMN04487890_11939 [Mucilaginibacter polytrichastri]